jgi:hypothetical protein
MLRSLITQILAGWPTATREQFKDHPIAKIIRQDFKDEISSIISNQYSDYIISGSAGAGNWANVPWLSILNPRITETTQAGIYPVYLFCADGSGVYLSLMQGTTAPQQRLGKAQADIQAANYATKIRKELVELAEWGGLEIDLKANTSLGKSYEKAQIAAKFYPASAIPSDEQLKTDLLQAMSFYEAIEPIWQTLNHQAPTPKPLLSSTPLPKPFLLLAGISGTGKSRFVRQQAKQHRADLSNFCLIAVRPDWHEPSDLLGYISRIGGNGKARYVVTDLLKFMVDAWLDAMESANDSAITLKPIETLTPFWLCLDEMNLAPVEQYFADYLAIIETREWSNGEYSCHPLLKKASLDQVEDKPLLRDNLGLNASQYDGLWAYFCANGIALPPNLIVAGTVNMDETTHGFSRKVIDRAFTIDFGVFYPNDFDAYFSPKTQAKTLSFPLLSKVTADDLSDCLADSDGSLSIGFLTAINKVLKDTPFELAYRALNELLLAVVSFAPQDARQLQAVWDDFLMSKLLPRIDGDGEKLKANENGSLLTQLSALLETQLSAIWAANRPDLLRENLDGSACEVDCRSKAKLAWMQDRLANNGFTSFWP